MSQTVAETSSSSPSASSRRAALLGVLFPVLFFVAFFLNETPENNESDAKWTSYFASSSHQTGMVVSAFLFTIAALCMLAFMTRLWSLVAAAHRPEHLSPLGLVASAVAAASIAAGGAINAAIAGAMAFGNGYHPAAEILRASSNLGYPLIAVAGMFATALAIAVLSVQAHRVGFFGKRLMIFSLVVAVITLGATAFFPMLVTLVWFLVITAVMWKKADASAAARPVTD